MGEKKNKQKIIRQKGGVGWHLHNRKPPEISLLLYGEEKKELLSYKTFSCREKSSFHLAGPQFGEGAGQDFMRDVPSPLWSRRKKEPLASWLGKKGDFALGYFSRGGGGKTRSRFQGNRSIAEFSGLGGGKEKRVIMVRQLKVKRRGRAYVLYTSRFGGERLTRHNIN